MEMPEKLDFGPPDFQQMLPPVVRRNYGKWDYYEHMGPGVLKHVAESGEAVYTVRAGGPKFVSPATIRKICDLADRYCGGYLRFTSRHSIEFLLTEEDNIDPLIRDLKEMGLPVGGTGKSMASIIQCTAWVHCHTPATDSPGIGKALYDELYPYFSRTDLPAKLKIAVAGCLNMCGAVHCSDIAVLGMHRVPPRVDDDVVSRACEIPTLISSCPTYAIKPKMVTQEDGGTRRSIQIDASKCMYCGICYSLCPGVPLADPENDGVSIWVGGKVSSARSGPAFSRLAVPYIPNDPPRWPEVTKTVKKIIEVWTENAEEDERVGEWIGRIGWERFFELTGIPFTEKHIDDFTFSIRDMRAGVLFRMPRK